MIVSLPFGSLILSTCVSTGHSDWSSTISILLISGDSTGGGFDETLPLVGVVARVGTRTCSFIQKNMDIAPHAQMNAEAIAKTPPADNEKRISFDNPTNSRKLKNDRIPMQVLIIVKHSLGFGYLKHDAITTAANMTHTINEPKNPINRPNFQTLPIRSFGYRIHPPIELSYVLQ
jgi:hypothetical protein